MSTSRKNKYPYRVVPYNPEGMLVWAADGKKALAVGGGPRAIFDAETAYETALAENIDHPTMVFGALSDPETAMFLVRFDPPEGTVYALFESRCTLAGIFYPDVDAIVIHDAAANFEYEDRKGLTQRRGCTAPEALHLALFTGSAVKWRGVDGSIRGLARLDDDFEELA